MYEKFFEFAGYYINVTKDIVKIDDVQFIVRFLIVIESCDRRFCSIVDCSFFR